MTESAASRAARALGALGASKGGKASAAALTPEQRSAKGRAAVQARWSRQPDRPVRLTVTERDLLTQVAGGPVRVDYSPARVPTGARPYRAAHRLVARGLARVVVSSGPEPDGSASVTIGPVDA